ncbi:adventurous gliding motility lipoprotein CglC [Archangium sp.]|uniref:adventurous gliding motility lipoprotein CglC n=1 Tax=Archangium sp. TaxID=1872627 RepID=UPI002D5BBD69|nr:adventurous gliding motility lipoprotein CglC [Archangium sp.]HYO57283.1 adventurous gliding motility lipoprotein CglC [Archangium sp.]
MSARLALLVGAALLSGGCEVASDIGKPCVLVRKATAAEQQAEPDREPFRDIYESQLQAGQDFISFGSVECEDLVCVRDAAFDPKLEATDNPATTQAKGYCSKACVPPDNTQLQDPCAVNHPQAEAQVKETMSCRPLLLDQKALDDLRANDPATYRATFGDNASPNFCASKPAASN